MATASVSCADCEYSYFKFISLYEDNTPAFLDYLRNHGVIPTSVMCEKCNLPCTLRQDANLYYCGRYVRVQKKRKRPCNYAVSLFKGTFLDHARLPPWEIGLFVHHFVQKFWHYGLILNALGWSSATSIRWRSFCSEVTLNWLHNQEPIGGPQILVEIDETFFVKGQSSQMWLFGGIERESKRRFVIPFHQEGQDISAGTLMPLIKKYIRPGSVVVSNGCSAYATLSKEGYVHKVINDSENFVDTDDPTVDTLTIKRQWRNMKKWAKRPGMRAKYFEHYFARCLFIDTYPVNTVHHFFIETGKLYKPHGSHPRPPVYDSEEESLVDSLI